ANTQTGRILITTSLGGRTMEATSIQPPARLMSTPAHPRAPAKPSLVSDRSLDLLCQLDDDPLGAADVAEPVAVLVPHQLADEFGAMGPQAVEDILDAFHREHNMPDARRVRRSAGVAAPSRRRLVLDQL